MINADDADLPEFVQDVLSTAAPAEEIACSLVALSNSLPPINPSASLKARVLASGESPALRFAPFFSRTAQFFDCSLQDAEKIFERASQACEWHAAPLPGVELFHINGGPTVAAADCGLLRIAAGTHFPQHIHLGEERTLILRGSVQMASGEVYCAGDRIDVSEGSTHAFSVLPKEPLLFAVVQFNGIAIDGQVYRAKS